MSSVCNMLLQGCNLKKLSISKAELSDTNILTLCQVLEEATCLTELDLSANKMTARRMRKLTRVLAENQQLQIINLSWNFLTQNETINNTQVNQGMSSQWLGQMNHAIGTEFITADLIRPSESEKVAGGFARLVD